MLLGNSEAGFKTTKLWFKSKKACVERGKYFSSPVTVETLENELGMLVQTFKKDSPRNYICVKSTPTQ